ncbi:MAG: MobA/MobL family protein [Methyloglobulus sp.]|nr:MobA/MobL family protein [Methyloglobulus sp.]
MPSYHLSVKTISRSAGRSATAAAAYRAGVEIADQRTGEVHDYTRKGGVEYIKLVLPENAPSWSVDREALWNAAEQAETRKNSTVAREFEVALPSELSDTERQRLALDFAQEIVARHGCAADVAIHAPGKGGDHRNHHAHILCSTRKLTKEGFGAKTRELDDRTSGEVVRWRERFAELQNQRFQDNGIDAKVDHRSLQDQGIDREPTRHLGVAATGYERRTGLASRKRLDFEKEVAERLSKAKELGELEREAQALERSLLDLTCNLEKAKAERLGASLKSYRPLFEAVAQKAAEDGFDERQREAILAQAKETLIKNIESGAISRTNTKTRQEFEATAKKASQPAIDPVERAQQLKTQFFEAAKTTWKEQEAKHCTQQADGMEQKYWQLREQEPKEPLLFGRREWQTQHDNWADQVNGIRQEALALDKQAKAIRDGNYDNDWDKTWEWDKQAQERLGQEHPVLAQTLANHHLAEQQKAKAKVEINLALSEFKDYAIKRELKNFGIGHGYNDGGGYWQALPEKLRTRIDEFNKQPREARDTTLSLLRGRMERDPAVAQKLTQELKQAKDNIQELGRGRGWSR